MAVITCQGGVMINNCYNCMLMFACTFYNGFSAKKITFHSKQKSFCFSWRWKESYYWLWQHYISYEMNSFLLIHIYHTSFLSQKCRNYHRLIEYIRLDKTSGGHLFHIPWPTGEKGEALVTPEYWQHHAETQAQSLLQNNNTFNTLLLQCTLPVTVWFPIEISGTDWNPSGKLTTFPGNRNLSWKQFLMHLKMQET